MNQLIFLIVTALTLLVMIYSGRQAILLVRINQAMRDAIDAMTEIGHWQPIDTAPKDETPIIVGFDAASVWIVHLAWWRDGKKLKEQMGDIGDWSEDDTGWWSYTLGSVSQEKLDGYRTPTHWIPCLDIPT